MKELTINLHMHTVYSDGSGTHAELAADAIKAGLDAIIVTDHNVFIEGVEGYFENDEGRVLVLIGEEVHDQDRTPQKNHMLVFNAKQQMAIYADDPQMLINQIHEAGGICFLAHPTDPAAPAFNESDLSWVDWEVNNYTGIELWNAMTEFKSLLSGYLPAIWYAFNFKRIGHGPPKKTLEKWDELHAEGRRVVAVGGSDAHRMRRSLGPISRTLFPYVDHYRAVNTHLLVPEALNGDLDHDKTLIYEALGSGHAFVGYDLPAPTRGFRFTAHTPGGDALMGDKINYAEGSTLQIKMPRNVEFTLLKDGAPLRTVHGRDQLIHRVKAPGVYRVEATIPYKGVRRSWIYSNPIYVR